MLDDLDRASASAEGLELAAIEDSVKMLATARPDQAWTALERSENLKMQRMLLDALAGVGPLLLPKAMDALRSENPDAVRHAASLLPRIGGAPRDLEHAARHPNERVRREVLRALRAMPPDATAMELVVAFLTDVSPELQKAARPMLRGDLLTPRAIADLRLLADDGDRAIELRERVVEVLAQSTRDEAAAALFALLSPQSLLELGTFRESVARALRRSRAQKAASYFAEGLKSPIRRVRWACEKAASD
jgi:HEAT repeat protein